MEVAPKSLGPNAAHEFFAVFAEDLRALSRQSILIYGETGTFRSRLAVTLAVLLSISRQRNAMVLDLEWQPLRPVCEQIVQAWPLPFEEPLPVFFVSEESCFRPHIRMGGRFRNWDRLERDLEWYQHLPFTASEAERAKPRMDDFATYVIDPVGAVEGITRKAMAQFLRISANYGKTVILVGEESSDEPGRSVTQMLRHVCDIVVHTTKRLPEGTQLGLTKYYMRVEKSRYHNHCLDPYEVTQDRAGRITLIPPLSFWSRS